MVRTAKSAPYLGNVGIYAVTPAKAGVQSNGGMDSRLRGNDNVH